MRKNSDVIGAFPDNCNYILIVSHHLVVHCPFDLCAEPFCLKRLFFQFLYRASGKIGIALFLLITVWFLG